MATFLTTSKMDPALAARIEASVSGRKGSAVGARAAIARTRRVIALARVVLVLTVAFGIYGGVAARRDARRKLEEARTALLQTLRDSGAPLSAEEQAVLPRVEGWLGRLSREYEGDHVARELAPPGALANALARPIVYVRGSAGALDAPAQVAVASASSTKDALVLCLLEPPESRVEKAVLDKVRVAYSGGWNLESRTPNVRRLNDAVVGVPLLLPAWADRVRATQDAAELARLRADLARAPIQHARQALRAELLLVAIDELGDGKGPTELDGERIHPVRVALVDLARGEVLLRARHVVDPSWVTPARRATYAIGFDSCALALDVHEDVKKAR